MLSKTHMLLCFGFLEEKGMRELKHKDLCEICSILTLWLLWSLTVTNPLNIMVLKLLCLRTEIYIPSQMGSVYHVTSVLHYNRLVSQNLFNAFLN